MKKVIATVIFAALCLAFFYIFFVDGTYRTPVQAIEQARNLDEPIEVVREQETDHGKVVFYLRYIRKSNPKPVISVDNVTKMLAGWKWVTGGGHTLMETVDGMNAQEKLDAEWSVQRIPAEKGSPFPMFFGAVVNPEIAMVKVTSAKTASSMSAEMVRTGTGMKIWYLYVDESLGEEFTLEALSAEGQVLSTQQWDGKLVHAKTRMREEGLQ